MSAILFLPGLGADERLFRFVDLPGIEKKYLRWVAPVKGESLKAYCLRVKDQVKFDEPPVLIGVSMGGVAAMELRELMPVKKTIIISSIKTRFEHPAYFSIVKKIKLNEKISPAMLKKGASLIKPFITQAKSTEAIKLFEAMVKDADSDFISWGIRQVLYWEKEKYNNENLVHIHGTKDLVFPLRNISHYDYAVKGGAHDMIMSRPEEVAVILRKELDS